MDEAAVAGGLKGAATGAVHAGMELLDAVLTWIVPLIAVAVGALLGGGIGLSGAIARLLDLALPANVPAQAVALVASLASIGIWGGIGAGLWAASSSQGSKWGKYIMRPIGALFFGFALSELGPVFKSGVNDGVLSTMISQTASAASK